MIKCVFFDFDEVLRSWEYALDGLENEFGVPLSAFREVAFAPENVGLAITGQVTDEEWRKRVRQILIERFPDRDAAGAWQAWVSRDGVINPEVLELIKECKKHVRVGMISNATSRLSDDMRHHGIDKLFDYVINTSEIGVIKPDAAVYEHTVKVAEIQPKEAWKSVV